MAFSQTLKASDDEIPESDVGEILHPVFSPMLHSSHRAAWHQTFEELSDILPEDIGLTPVQVVNHTMQWEDFAESQISATVIHILQNSKNLPLSQTMGTWIV